MNFSEFINYFFSYFQNPYELWGFITSLICVWLNTRENIWGWLFGIIAGILYFKFFWDIRLFGDMYLQIFFIIISVYGWYEWLYGTVEKKALQVTHTPLQTIWILLACLVLGILLMGLFLKWQKGDLIWMDATTTTISLIAQWMMARKYLENWLVWIFVNFLYVGMYSWKAAYLTAFLYAIFILLASSGYISWKHNLQKRLSTL